MKTSIRVLHVCYLTPSSQNGYEIRVLEETALLSEKGTRIILLVFINKIFLFPIKRLIKFYLRLRQFTGATVYIVPTSHFFDLHLPPEGNAVITRAITSIARIHRVKILHGQALYSTMHILRARHKLDAKIVFEVHGASPEETEMSGGHINRTEKLAEWEQEALRSANHFNFVSHKMRNHFQKKYALDVANYSVIPCCVHTDKFAMQWDERERKRKELGLTDRFVIAYLGTLTVWQWPEAMFSLFAQLYKHKPDCFLFLLIPANDHDKARSFISQLNIPADAYRLEEVSHDKVGSILGVADAGLLLRKSHPVNYVASPTKFGEYLAAGVSIVATDCIGDTSEIIQKENIGIIISVSDDGLPERDLGKILQFVDELQLRRKSVSERCTEVACKTLEWKSYENALVDNYRNITSI